jgi:hypothetical protein
MISTNHQKIQTMVTITFRLPIGEPTRPATRRKKRATRLGTMTAKGNHRRVTSQRRRGKRWRRSSRHPRPLPGATSSRRRNIEAKATRATPKTAATPIR